MYSLLQLSDLDSSFIRSEHRQPKISGSISGTDKSSSPLHNVHIDTGARQTLVHRITEIAFRGINRPVRETGH